MIYLQRPVPHNDASTYGRDCRDGNGHDGY